MFEDLLKEIEATEEERRPTPGQAAVVSTPTILQCGELLKEIEPAKNQHDAQADGGPSRKQATTPTARQAVDVSTPVKHTRRRALVGTPPPHPEPLTDGQQGPLSFLYSVIRDGVVERGVFISQCIRSEPEALLCLRERYPGLSGCNGRGWSHIGSVEDVGTTPRLCCAMPIDRPIMQPLWGAVEGTKGRVNYEEGHSMMRYRLNVFESDRARLPLYATAGA